VGYTSLVLARYAISLGLLCASCALPSYTATDGAGAAGTGATGTGGSATGGNATGGGASGGGGTGGDAVDPCDNLGAGGSGDPQQPPPSCADSTAHPKPMGCGEDKDQDCCASDLVTGGDFLLSYDGVTFKDETHPARISSFRLDRFEVTVGRFRAFLADYTIPAPEEQGNHPVLINEIKWLPEWSALVEPDAATVLPLLGLSCSSSNAKFTEIPSQEFDSNPMNCTSWFEAWMFCHWDGGWLPTEAEWNYAAAGGNEQREFAWGPSTLQSIQEYAAVCATFSDSGECIDDGNPKQVGSYPLGRGRYCQHDLTGNVDEWTNGGYSSSLSEQLCSDCMDTDFELDRPIRGGDYKDTFVELLLNDRHGRDTDNRGASRGFRCARPAL